MSADVQTVYLHHAYCPECATGSESDENEDAALEWAANHNAENHSDYTDEDAADDAREHNRESRLGY
jgi:hypothetical protein